MGGIVKAIGGVVSGVVGAVGSIFSGVIGAVGKVVSSVINFVLSPFLGLFGLGQPSMPDVATPQTLSGVLVQREGSDVNVPVVYGFRKIGGTVVFCETGSTTNKYLWVAYTFAEGPVEGLYALWIDDTQVPAVNIPNLNTGIVTTVTGKTTDPKTGVTADCKFNGLVQLQFWCGLGDFVDPTTYGVGGKIKAGIFNGSPSFTNDMYFNGLVTVFARYEWPTTGTNPFSGSIPKLQISLMGRRVTSLVSGSPETINYGSNDYTERYSTNPAEILLDYLRNPAYGKGLKNNEIDWSSFKTAAAKCNTEVEYANGIKGPILTLNMVVPTTDTIFNNCKKMLSNFRAYLPYSQGKYRLLIEDAGNPTDILSGSATISQTFTKDDIQGDITYTGIERNSKYNLVKVNYTDPDQQWSTQTVYYPEDDAARQALKAKDGGRENTYDITAEGLTNPSMAKDMARLALYKSRYQDSITLVVSSKAMELEPGDNVYVQANILRFGTDPNAGAIPWRVISMKLNNDMTYSLGLIRNPDIIYPYTRYNEIDYAFATYIPKGADRYYPLEPIGTPIGYHPPGRRTDAPNPPDDGTKLTVTPPTDPTGGGGGGVGGTGSVPNQPGGNNPPGYYGGAPLSGTDLIKITQVSFVQSTPTSSYATLTFTQPATPGYGSTVLFWKRNSSIDTNYQSKEIVTRPGAGQIITATIGPLVANTPYVVKSLVKYINNFTSTVTEDAYFTALTSGSTIDINNTNTTTIDSGWRLPITPVLNDQDAQIKIIVGAVTTPSNPRVMQIIFTQKGANTYVSALHVFYKLHSASYWKEYIYKLPNAYVPGDTCSFLLTGLGATNYPTPPTGTSQFYDFRFRFEYIDNQVSLNEYAVDNARVEYNGTSYVFNSFATPPTASDVVALGNQAVINHPLESQNPISAGNPKDMTVGLIRVKTTGVTSTVGNVSFYFNPPDASNLANWLGVKIYYRQILAGTNPAFASSLMSPAGKDPFSSAYLANLAGLNFTYGYQFVIVPVVIDTGGARVDATNCWIGSGNLSGDTSNTIYPTDGNWFSSLAFSQTTTATALGQLQTTFPGTNPVANVLSFKKYQLIANVKTSNAWYYQLKFQVPSAFTSSDTVYIYRRSQANYSFDSRVYALYYGIGRWERITVTTTSNSSYDAGTNTFTVNLRGTSTWSEFNPSFGINGNTTLLRPITAGIPGGGVEFTSYESTGLVYDEFIIVLKMAGTESTKLIALPPATAAFDRDYDLIGSILPNIRLQSEYNNLTAGYQRNLTDYRSAPATGSMYIQLVGGGVSAITVPSLSPGVQ